MSQEGVISPSPTLQLEPTFTYDEAADALGVSLSLIQKEAASGRLRTRRLGRRSVVTQRDIDEWWEGRYDRRLDVRAARVTRKDQRQSPKVVNAEKPQADPDILERLGYATK